MAVCVYNSLSEPGLVWLGSRVCDSVETGWGGGGGRLEGRPPENDDETEKRESGGLARCGQSLGQAKRRCGPKRGAAL